MQPYFKSHVTCPRCLYSVHYLVKCQKCEDASKPACICLYCRTEDNLTCDKIEDIKTQMATTLGLYIHETKPGIKALYKQRFDYLKSQLHDTVGLPATTGAETGPL